MPKGEKDFVKGLFVKEPHANAPDFVKANLSIKLKDFSGWINEKKKSVVKDKNGDRWLRMQILESKDGNTWYAQFDDWEPTQKTNDILDDDEAF